MNDLTYNAYKETLLGYVSRFYDKVIKPNIDALRPGMDPMGKFHFPMGGLIMEVLVPNPAAPRLELSVYYGSPSIFKGSVELNGVFIETYPSKSMIVKLLSSFEQVFVEERIHGVPAQQDIAGVMKEQTTVVTRPEYLLAKERFHNLLKEFLTKLPSQYLESGEGVDIGDPFHFIHCFREGNNFTAKITYKGMLMGMGEFPYSRLDLFKVIQYPELQWIDQTCDAMATYLEPPAVEVKAYRDQLFKSVTAVYQKIVKPSLLAIPDITPMTKYPFKLGEGSLSVLVKDGKNHELELEISNGDGVSLLTGYAIGGGVTIDTYPPHELASWLLVNINEELIRTEYEIVKDDNLRFFSLLKAFADQFYLKAPYTKGIDIGVPSQFVYISEKDGIVSTKVVYNGMLMGSGEHPSGDIHSFKVTKYPEVQRVVQICNALSDHLEKEAKLEDKDMKISNSPWEIAFQEMIKKFNDTIVQPTYQLNRQGLYEWPVGDFTIRVALPNVGHPVLIPFKILRQERVYGEGLFELGGEQEVKIAVFPSDSDLANLNLGLSRMLGEVSPDINEKPVGVTLALLDGEEINDEWIEWYRKENPGTSYTKAVIRALTLVKEEVKRMTTVLDKYKLPY